jgi:hypothetical protein
VRGAADRARSAKNFPFRKVPGTVDAELPDGTADPTYLQGLAAALAGVLAFAPQRVFFQAGVDPLREGRLGRLELTHDGLMARDHMVLKACRERGAGRAVARRWLRAAHRGLGRGAREHLSRRRVRVSPPAEFTR